MSAPAPLYCQLAEAPEHGRAFWLRAGRRRIRAAVWEGSGRGVALIFQGRSEYIEKYGRVVSALVGRGFAVATLDWRGQGLSDRALEDPLKGHVGEFAAYQRDVDAFLALPEIAGLPGPRVLFCHSMGGCIGMRALLDERVSPVATVMSAPMLGIEMTPMLRFAAETMVALSRRFGFESAYAPAPNAKQPYVLSQPFEGNLLTGDREHFEWFVKHLEAEPGFALAGPTLRWLGSALEETEALAMAIPPGGPMLVGLGGEEKVVSAETVRAFVARAPDCRLIEFPHARHELFVETEAVRARLWRRIDRFFREVGI
ncbi:MAG: alpha/beta fold hydrolase [Pikeienuella sp.]|uniref:alpha/beta fold hydrolase n=1 Tax=Pikeienuella sp. TaxID=2831957 RepID=UPI00391D9E69